MHFSQWRSVFEHRQDHPCPVVDDTTEIPPSWRPSLADSLARFQLGETGEGRIVAHVRARAHRWPIDDDYIEALRLFIAEEGRHAAILGRAVRALGGTPLRRSWSATAFTRVRRLAGPGAELLVLLAAEVAAQCFYDALSARLPRGPLRRAMASIAADEAVHLRFHIDFFSSTLPSTTLRELLMATWRPLGLAAIATLMADHRTTLHTLGISPCEVWAQGRGLVGETATAIASAPTPKGRRQRIFWAWATALGPSIALAQHEAAPTFRHETAAGRA